MRGTGGGGRGVKGAESSLGLGTRARGSGTPRPSPGLGWALPGRSTEEAPSPRVLSGPAQSPGLPATPKGPVRGAPG